VRKERTPEESPACSPGPGLGPIHCMNCGYGRRFFVAFYLVFAGFGLIEFSAPAFADGTAYYINNQAHSNCSDAGPHTLAQPWCSFAPINRLRILAPGDQVLLARGSTWDQQLSLTGVGTVSEPITLTAYGNGADPRILRDQATDDICVLLSDASYWNISHLELGQASVGILLHFTQLSNNGITISNLYVHDNKGIWGGYSPQYPVSHGRVDPFAASLNINLSAGILFNISSRLSFNSSQYVLSGISLSNISGTKNLDSVAFDAETTTTDGQDGHNAFQNIVLNGLILSTDDGNADEVYQSAGLGCSDSLRLLGVMNLTLLDSVLYDEAACHTASGTAAVILGRVANINFTNNILFGVPVTSSPDETGIDFEFSESNVNLFANLFAENAGAGLELLNIHEGDHTTGVNIVDNTFLNNALSHSAKAASVLEISDGSGDATPTVSIQNNLYSEKNGPFFEGGNDVSIATSNNLPTSTVPNYAAEEFSSTQGLNGWRYMYEPAALTWKDLPNYSPTDYNGAWEVNPAQYVSAFELTPASCIGRRNIGGVARVWVAPRNGLVNIRGRVLKSDAGGGTGVFAEINLVSGRRVSQIWPASGSGQLIAGSDQVGFATDVNNVYVNAGDMIRFEISANGENSYDKASWTPAVGYALSPLPSAAAPSPSETTTGSSTLNGRTIEVEPEPIYVFGLDLAPPQSDSAIDDRDPDTGP
jgi:hypothetical protein